MSLTQWLQKFVAKTPRGGTKSIPPLGLRAARLHFEPLEERRVFSVTPTLNGNVLEILLDADGDTATLRTEDLDANLTDELNVYDQNNTLVGTFDFGTFESITLTGDGGNGGVQTVVFENTIPLALAGDLSANGGDIESIEFQGDMALGGLLDLAVGESIELGAGADLSADAGILLFAIGPTIPTNISMDATSSLTTLGGIVILASEGSVTAGSLTADNLISVNGSTGITFQNDVTFTSASTADFQVNADQGDVTIDGDILTPNATGGSFMLYLDAGLGTAGTLFLNGDIHAPPAAGQITVDGNLTLGSGFSFDQLLLTGTTLGGPYDTVGSSILVMGANRTVDLGGATFTFSKELGYLPQVGDEFGVITLADASSVITGSFTNRAEGDEFYSDDVRYEFSQSGGDGNDVVLTILSPTTVWVDDDFSALSNGDDPAGPAAIFGYDGFATVQGGVSQVADAGLVNVASGTYSDVSQAGKSFTLRGEGGASTFITSPLTAIMVWNASFLTIEEITLNGTTALDVANVDTTTLTNITTVGTASVTGLDLILISDGSDDDIFSVGDDGITTSGLLNIAYLTTTVDNLDLQGGGGDDQFFIRPQPATVITLDGGNGNDALEADFYQLFDFADTPGIPGAGVLTAHDRELAAYSSIETVTTSIVPDATLEAQFPDDGTPDNWLVKRSDSDPAILEVYVNGVLAFQQDYASTTKLTINGSTDDDTLTVDLTNGDIQLADGIHFNGGDGTDAVVLVSANDVTKVTHTFTSDTEGSIEIVGLSSDLTTISYTGLDPIVDNLSAATREFIFTGGDETISLTDDAAVGYNLIDSSLGESVLFLNPTDTLIITVQEGDDTFTAGSLDAGFAANILVSMDDVNNVAGDALVWNANATLGSVGVAGTFELAVAGGTISVNAAVNNTAGGGSFVLDASGNIIQQGSLTTNSDITIESTGGTVTTATLAANDVLSEITITGMSIILAGDVTSANLVDITATAGSIEQTGGTVNSPTLSLDAQTGIFGTTAMVARAMEISASTITATTNTGGIQLENAATAATTATLTATTGDILFNQTGGQSLTLANVATSGNASLANDAALTLNSALISGSGELTLDGTQVILGGNITANGQATITASDTITQLAGILTSPILVLDAQNGIGLSADAVEISTSDVTATTATTGLFLDNDATAATQATLTATTGDIVFTQSGTQTLTVNSVTTGDGDIDVSNTGADLTVTTAEARGGDGNVTLATIAAGSLLLGAVDADGAIVLTGVDGVVVDGAGHVTAEGVGRTITVNGNLTTAGDLTTNDGQITIQGDLILAGSVSIDSNSSGSGTGADVSVNGPNGIDLDAFTLTINAGPSGDVQTDVVNGDPTSSLVVTNAHDVTIGAGGLTTGSATLNLGGDFTNSSITSVSGLIQVTAGGDILFQDTIDAGSVDLAAREDITLNGDVTAATSVKASANADSALADGVLTTKAITTTSATSTIELRGDAVELGGDITTGAAAGSTVLVVAGTGAITQTAGTITAPVLTLESQTGIGAMGNLLEISTRNLMATTAAGGIFLGNTATQATSATLTATAGNIVLTQTGGQNLTLTSVIATNGDATLSNDVAIEIQQASVLGTGRLEIEGTSVTLDGDVAAANSVHIVATSGAIIQTAGTITTADLGLFATGAIGATGQRIQTDAARLAARSTGGDLFLTNSGDLEIGGATFNTFTGASAANIDVLVDTGSLNVTSDIAATAAVTLESDAAISMASGTNITATSAMLTAVGNITLAEIIAGTIDITSTGGSIQDVDVSDSTVNLNAGAGSITLAAAMGIGTTGGAAGTLELSGKTISATSTTGGMNLANVSNATTGAVTASNLQATTSGNISFTQTGGQSLTVDGVTTGDGDINVSNSGADLTVTTAEARGDDGNITLATITTGSLLLGDVDADGAIVLTGVDGVVVGVGGHVTADDTGSGITVNGNLNTAGNLTTNDGLITINGNLTLADSVSIDSNNSGSGNGTDVTVTGDVDLATFTLTIDAGPDGDFSVGDVTGTTGDLVIEQANSLSFDSLTADTISIGPVTGDITIGLGGLTANNADFELDGDFTNNGATDVTNHLFVQAGGSIEFVLDLAAGSLELDAGTTIDLENVTVDTTTVLTSVGALTVGGNFDTGTTSSISSGDATFTGTYRSGGNTSITSTGDVLFEATVDVDGDLTILASDGITLGDGLADTVDVSGNLLLDAGTNVDVAGAADVVGDATVLADGDIDFGSSLGAGGMLSLTAGTTSDDEIRVVGDIGANTAPTSITLSAGGLIAVDGTLAAGGDVTANAGTSLDFDKAITTTGAGSDILLSSGTTMRLAGAVNGSGEVELDNGGLLSILDPAGITAAGRVVQIGTGDVSLHGDITSTSGEVDFAEDVVLTSDVVVTSGSTITFQKTINGTTAGAEDLTLDAATTVTLGGLVGGLPSGTTRLGVLTIDGTTVTTAGITAAALDGETTTGHWETTGNVDITGLAKFVAADSFTLTGNLNAGEVEATANGDLTITGATSTSAGGDVTLTTLTTGNIAVGAIDADGDVRVTSAGSYTQNGNVEAGGLIDVNSFGALLTTGTLTAGTTIDLESTNDSIEIQQAVSAGGNVALIGNTGVTLDAAGDVAATNAGSTITVTGDLTTSGDLVTNSGAILINDDVTLVGDVLFDSNSSDSVGGGADITVNGAAGINLDDFTLTIDAGTVGDVVTDRVTGTSLSAFVITNANDVSVGTGNLTAGTVTIDLVGNFTNHGTATVDGLLDVAAGGNILFQQAVDAESVDLAANEDVTLNGDVTAVTSVKVVANANGALPGGDVTTRAITTTGPTTTIELRGDAVDLRGDIEAGESVLVVATSGAITQLAGTTITTDDLGLFAAGDIGTGGQFFQTDVDRLAVRSTSGDVFLENAGDLEIGGATFESFTGASAGRDLTINLVSGALDVSEDIVATEDITLTSTDGMTISGDVLSGTGTITLDADSDATGGGVLNVTGTGSVTATAEAIRITASDVTLAGTLAANGAGTSGPNNAPVGYIEIRQSMAAATIGLGSAAGDLSLDAAELANITTNQLVVGRSDGGDVSIAAAGDFSSHIGTLVLLTNGNVAGTVDGSPDVAVGQLAIVAGGQVALDFDVTTLAVSAGNAATGHVLRDTAGGLTIGSIAESLGGTLVTGVQTGTGSATIETLGGNTGDLVVNSPIVSGGNSLTLVADDDVTLNADVTLATGTLVIEADADGSGDGEITIATGVDVAVTTGLTTDTIILCAADLDLAGTVDVGLGTVQLLTSTAAGTFGLGSGDGTFEVTQAELDQITANRLLVGSATKTNAGIELGDVSWTGAGKEVRLTTDGAITQDAGSTLAITTPTLVLDAATGINLLVNADNLSARNRTSGDIVLVDTAGGLTIANDLAVGGFVNQAAGGAIDLRVAANTLTTAAGAEIVTNVGHIRLRADEYVLGAGVDAGTETVLLQHDTAGRTISLNGAVAGINLSQAELQGIVAGSLEVGGADAGNVSVGDIDGLFVTTLAIITNGSIQQFGICVITVTNLALVAQTGIDLTTRVDTLALRNGTSGSVTIDQGNRALTLGEVDLKFFSLTGITQNGSGDLSITTANSVTITEEISSSGNVLIDAVGAISQQAGINAVGDAVTLESDATIGMASGTNITATSASLTAAGDITLAEIVAGTIGVTSTGGSIQDVNVSDSTVNLNAGAGSITLAAATGIGTTGGAAGTLELSGKTISATSTTGGMNLANVSNATTGAVTATNLQATTSGNISFTQTGGQSLSVTNVSTTSGNAAISNAGDLSVAAASILGTNGQLSLTTTASGNTSLGTAATAGNLLVTIAGSFTQTGNTTVGGLLDVEAVNAVDIQGTQGVTGTTSIVSTASTLRLRQALTSGGAVTLDAANLLNGGVTLDATGDVVSTTGGITVIGNLTTAGDLVTDDRPIVVQGNVLLEGDVLFDSDSTDAGTGADVTIAGDVDLATFSLTIDAGPDGDFSVGDVTGTTGDLVIEQANSLSFDSLTADTISIGPVTGDITIGLGGLTANSADFELDGDFTNNGATNVTNHLFVQAGGSIEFVGDLEAGSLELDAGTTIDLGNVTVDTTTILTSVGALTVGGDFDTGTTSTISSGEATFVGSYRSGGRTEIASTGNVLFQSTLDVDADGLEIIADGTTTFSQTVTVVGNAVIGDTNSETVQALAALDVSGDLTITTAGDIDLDGTVDVGGNLLFDAGMNVDVAGATDVVGDATVTADDDIDFGSTLDVGGALSLTAGTASTDDIRLAGNVGATRTPTSITLAAGGLIEALGTVTTSGLMEADAGTSIEVQGLLTADLLDLDAGTDITLEDVLVTTSSLLRAGGNIEVNGTFDTGSLDAVAGGTTTFNDTITVTTGNAVIGDANSGTVQALAALDVAGDLTITTADDIDLDGTVDVGGNLLFDAGMNVNVAGATDVVGNATVTADDDIDFGDTLDVGGALSLTAGTANTDDIRLAGNVGASRTPTLIALDAGGLIQALGTVTTSGLLEADAGTSIEVQGLLTANALHLEAGTDITLDDVLVTTSSLLRAGDAILVNGTFNTGSLDAVAGGTTTFNQAVDVRTGNASVGDAASGTVRFQETLDVFGSLTITSADDILLDGDVDAGGLITWTAGGLIDASGTVAAGGILTADAGTSLNFDQTVTTTGAGSDILLSSGTTMRLAGAVNSSGEVELDNGGLLSILDPAGIIAAGRVVQIGTGDVSLHGDITSTSGEVNFAEDVVLTSDVVITSGSTITFQKTINGTTAGAEDLTLNAVGDVTLGGAVGNTTRLGALVIDAAEVSTQALTVASLDGTSQTGNWITTGNIDATGAVLLEVAGNLEVNGNLEADSLDAVADGTSLFAGTVDVTNNAMIGSVTSGTVTINDQVTVGDDLTVRSANDITMGDGLLTDGVDVTGAAVIGSVAGDVTVRGTTEAGSLDADAGNDVLFDGAITTVGGMVLNAGQNIGVTGAIDAGTTFSATATAGAISLDSTLTTGVAADLTSGTTTTVLGAASIDGNLEVLAGDTIRFAQTLDATGAVTLETGTDASDDILLEGAVGGVGSPTSITLTAGGKVLASSSVTTSGLLEADAETSIEVQGLLTANALDLDAGTDITLDDVLMTTSSLLRAGGNIEVNGTFDTGSLDAVAGGTTTFDEAVTVTTGNAVIGDTNSGTVHALAALDVSGDLTITTAGDIDLDGTVDVGGNLLFDAGLGVNIAGATDVVGDATVTADDDIDFGDTLDVGGALSLTAGTANTDDIRLAGNVGATRTPTSITLAAGGLIEALGTVTTSGLMEADAGTSIEVQGLLTANSLDLEAGTDITLEDVSITTSSLIAAVGDLLVNGTYDVGTTSTITADDATFVGAYETGGRSELDLTGNFEAQSTFTVVSGGLELLADGTTTFVGVVEITGAAVIGELTSGTINAQETFTVTGGDLTLRSADDIDFDRALDVSGAIVATAGNDFLAQETIDAASLTIDATRDVLIDGAVVTSGLVDVTAGRDAVFGDTLDAGTTLTVTATTGDARFVGVVTAGGETQLTAGQELRLDDLLTVVDGDVTLQGATVLLDTDTVVRLDGAGRDLAITGTVTTGADLVTNGGDITVTGDSTFTDSIDIQTAGGNLTFTGTIDGQVANTFDLTIDTDAGFVDLQGAVGGANTLRDVLVSQAGDVSLVDLAARSFIVTDSSATVTFGGDVVTTAADGLDVTAEAIVMLAGSSLNSTGQDVVLTANDIDLSGDGITATGATVFLQTRDDATAIGLENSATAMNFTDAQFDKIVTNRLVIGTATNTGGITIGTDAPLTMNQPEVQLLTAGDVTVNGSLTVLGTGTLSVDAGDDVAIFGTLATTNGALVVNADDNITMGAAGRVSSTGGTITLAADADLTGAGSFTMTNGAVVESQTQLVTITAAGDVTVGQVISGRTGGLAIDIVSRNGAIIDGGDTGGSDLIANGAGAITRLDAATGIGSATGLASDAALETTVFEMQATNRTSGDIRVDETDALRLQDIDNQGPGAIAIQSVGTMTLLTGFDVTAASGLISLLATGAAADLLLNGSVTTTASSITLGAGRNVQFSGVTTVQTNGNIGITATNGTVRMLNGSVVNAGAGTIAVTANGDVSISRLVTTNATNNAVQVTSQTGGIRDSGESGGADIQADSAGALVTLRAVTGIGSVSDGGADAPLELQVARLDAINTTSGDIRFTEATGLNIERLTQQGAGQIAGVVNGATIITAAGQGISSQTGNVSLTVNGADADLTVLNNVSTTGGNITFNVRGDVTAAANVTIASQGGNIAIAADSDLNNVGGIALADGSLINAGAGTIVLSAAENIAVSRLVSTNAGGAAVSLTSRLGAITDAGDTGGVDIDAPTLVLRAATGIGSGNALETNIATLAARNTTSGGIQIDNTAGAGLNVGTVDGLTGITNAGANGLVSLVSSVDVFINGAVLNTAGGTIEITSLTGDITLNQRLAATGGNGSISLDADEDINLNDTGSQPDVEVQGTGSVVGVAGGLVNFAPNVQVASQTGAVTDVPPLLINVQTPQVQADGSAEVSGTFGRPGESNFIITVDWGDGTVETFYFDQPGNFLFTHQYFGNPDPNNPASPIPITVTIEQDPLIRFFEARVVEQNTTTITSFASVPGEGLAGSIPFDLTPPVRPVPEQPRTRLDEAFLSQSVGLSLTDVLVEDTGAAEDVGDDEIQVVIQVLGPNGEVLQEVILQESVLDDLPKLFKKLPDGQYRVVVREPGEPIERTVLELELRQGRIVNEQELDLDRPPREGMLPMPDAVVPAIPAPKDDATTGIDAGRDVGSRDLGHDSQMASGSGFTGGYRGRWIQSRLDIALGQPEDESRNEAVAVGVGSGHDGDDDLDSHDDRANDHRSMGGIVAKRTNLTGDLIGDRVTDLGSRIGSIGTVSAGWEGWDAVGLENGGGLADRMEAADSAGGEEFSNTAFATEVAVVGTIVLAAVAATNSVTDKVSPLARGRRLLRRFVEK